MVTVLRGQVIIYQCPLAPVSFSLPTDHVSFLQVFQQVPTIHQYNIQQISRDVNCDVILPSAASYSVFSLQNYLQT